MGDKLFSTAGTDGLLLKGILESPTILKVFSDVRNDSDALFSHFEISLAGIQDLQLMELATRFGRKKFVNSLAKCIEYDTRMKTVERQKWKATKEEGARLFAPEKGGSYDVFNDRPLSMAIQEYCVQDVEFLPRLWSVYDSKMSPMWSRKVMIAANDRVREFQREFRVSAAWKTESYWAMVNTMTTIQMQTKFQNLTTQGLSKPVILYVFASLENLIKAIASVGSEPPKRCSPDSAQPLRQYSESSMWNDKLHPVKSILEIIAFHNRSRRDISVGNR